MHRRLYVLQIWGVGELEAHRIGNGSLVYSEVVESGSDYKESYFWRCRNIVCGDSTGSNQIEKDRVRVPPGCFLGGRVRKGGVIYCLWASLDDRANGGFVDVFFHTWHGFSSMGTWCYSREWLWNLKTTLCCTASRK